MTTTTTTTTTTTATTTTATTTTTTTTTPTTISCPRPLPTMFAYWANINVGEEALENSKQHDNKMLAMKGGG